MISLSDSVRMKRWQAYVLLAMSGFAFGTILAKITSALTG